MGDLAQQASTSSSSGLRKSPSHSAADPAVPDIFWYCNCGAGFPGLGLAQSTDDGGGINYTAGYATGLKLHGGGGDSVVFIGCCDLRFGNGPT
jgi:hypothetical protein